MKVTQLGQESATDFMLRNARDFNEWQTIGDPRTMARIRECIRRYPKAEARAALVKTCMPNDGVDRPTMAGNEVEK